MKRQILLFSMMVVVLSLSSGPCDESLPSYQEPDKVFETSVESSYILTIQQNVMSIQLRVVNIFDETFLAQGVLQGSLEITSARDPSIKKTFAIKPGDLIRAPGYNWSTGMLLMNPRDFILFNIAWNFVDDNGIKLSEDFFKYVVDVSCRNPVNNGYLRFLAYREDFIIKGSLKIYEQRAPVEFGPMVYSMCHVSAWIDPKICTPIITSASCDARPPQGSKAGFPKF